MLKQPASTTLDTTLGFAAILLWSLNVALARSLTEHLGTVTTAFLVYTGGGWVGMALFVSGGHVRDRLREFSVPYLLTCGSLFVLCLSSFYLALGQAADHLQVLTVGLLNYLWPTLILVFSVPLLKTRARLTLIPAVLIVTAGEALALMQGQEITLSVLKESLIKGRLPFCLALVAALTWGLYSNFSRRFGAAAGKGAVPFFMLATGFAMGIYRLFVSEPTHLSPRTFLELCGLIITTNFGYVFWDRAMRRGNMLLVVSASYFIPLLSTLFACLYLGIALRSGIVLAAAFIVAGALMAKHSVREDVPHTQL
ncbi:MAG: aromatic amino acid DMT transporter YddG [Fibrobacterota bacterium]